MLHEIDVSWCDMSVAARSGRDEVGTAMLVQACKDGTGRLQHWVHTQLKRESTVLVEERAVHIFFDKALPTKPSSDTVA
jgi:hypothetical protein